MQFGSMRLRRACRNLAASAGMVLALASCSGTVSDDVSLDAVQSQGEGIVIIAASFPGGYFCSALVLHVSRTVDGKRRRDGFAASSLFKGDSPAQARLKAGSYELNNMVCHSGNYEVSLHKQPHIFSAHRDSPAGLWPFQGSAWRSGQSRTCVDQMGCRGRGTTLRFQSVLRAPYLAETEQTEALQPHGHQIAEGVKASSGKAEEAVRFLRPDLHAPKQRADQRWQIAENRQR